MPGAGNRLLPLFYHLDYQHISGKLIPAVPQVMHVLVVVVDFTRFEFCSTHLFVTVISQRKDKSTVSMCSFSSQASGPLFS